MLRANYQKLGSQFDQAAGGITNESRYAPKEGNRLRKRLTVPARNAAGTIDFDQGWNEPAKLQDVVKITVRQGSNKITMIVDRVDLEQVVFAMAQGDETIKYFKAEARAQRQWSEPAKKL